MSLYIIVLVLTGILGLYAPKNKFMVVISLLMMSYVFAFNTDNNAYDAYYNFYNYCTFDHLDYINNSPSSALFSYSVALANFIGLNFNLYRLAVFCGIFFLFFYNIGNQISSGVLLFSYGLILFFFDLVQIRFAIAEFMLLYGFLQLFNGKKYRFLIFVAISTFFHSMNVVFVVFFVLSWLEKMSFIFEKYFYCILLFILSSSIASAPIISAMQETVALIAQFDEYEHYMEQEVRYGFLLYVVYQIAGVFLARANAKCVNQETNNIVSKFVHTNYIVQMVGLLFVYPAMLNINFSRFMREFFILNVICFSVIVMYNQTSGIVNRKNYKMSVLYYMLILFVWITGEMFVNGSFNTITTMVFDSFK